MKKLILLIPILFSLGFSQVEDDEKFWEPLNISIQASGILFPKTFINKESNITRKLDTWNSGNLQGVLKVNQFEIEAGFANNESGSIIYNYGGSFFYKAEKNSIFLHIAHYKNFMKEKVGDFEFIPNPGTDPHMFDDYFTYKKRDLVVFDVGYRIVLKGLSVQAASGFAQGIGSKQKLAGPAPIFQFGIVVPLYKKGSSPVSDFN